jgi:hypothetical protein
VISSLYLNAPPPINNKQLLDVDEHAIIRLLNEVEQNIVICQRREDKLFASASASANN